MISSNWIYFYDIKKNRSKENTTEITSGKRGTSLKTKRNRFRGKQKKTLQYTVSERFALDSSRLSSAQKHENAKIANPLHTIYIK